MNGLFQDLFEDIVEPRSTCETIAAQNCIGCHTECMTACNEYCANWSDASSTPPPCSYCSYSCAGSCSGSCKLKCLLILFFK